MKQLTIVVICILVSMAGAPLAQAHVLIADDQEQVGAVLHITPDDDPIAGEPSTIFFDIQNNAISDKSHSFTLTVSQDTGEKMYIPITPAGSTVSATYAFPVQGLYELVLLAEPLDSSAKRLSFRQSQWVSRGEVAKAPPESTYFWAEVGLVASLCSLLVIGIIGFNKRSMLASYVSRYKF